MGFLGGVLNVVVTFCSSVFDVGSDFINSLDFLGYNISSTIASVIIEPTNSSEEFIVHQTWGCIGIGIIFLPGLVLYPFACLMLLSAAFHMKTSFTSKIQVCIFCIFGLLLIPTYPLAMIVAEITLLIMTCKERKLDEKLNGRLNTILEVPGGIVKNDDLMKCRKDFGIDFPEL